MPAMGGVAASVVLWRGLLLMWTVYVGSVQVAPQCLVTLWSDWYEHVKCIPYAYYWKPESISSVFGIEPKLLVWEPAAVIHTKFS